MISVPFNEVLAEPLRNGVYKKRELHGSGVPVINMKELFAFDRLEGHTSDRVTLEPSELPRVCLKTGDLLFARRSFVLEGSGKCSIVGSLPEPTTFESSMIRARLDRSRALPEYFYYFFKSPRGRDAMASISTRTAVSGITGRSLAALPVPLPPLGTQRKIVSVLSAYDDLIENNRRRIELLEELAQRTYREWFVDFRYPGCRPRASCTSASEESLPQGWHITSLGAIADWFSGGTPPTGEARYWGGDIPWITSGSLTAHYLSSSARTLTELGAQVGSRIVPRDAILFVVRGMSLAKEFRVGIADRPLAFGQDCKALCIHDRLKPLLVLHSLIHRAPQIAKMVEFAAHGTGKISTDRLMKLPVLVPPYDLQERFSSLAADVRGEIDVLNQSNRYLAHTREMLLPRLVSGVIDIESLEISLEESAA